MDNLDHLMNAHEVLRRSFEAQNELRAEKEALAMNANKATIDSKALLMEIAENTAYLKELVTINRETQLNTEELNFVMRAIFDVAKADNKEEADTLFSKAIKGISEAGETAGNVASLTTVAVGIYNTVIALL